jgi:glycerophosphoryl diester phosphodiesterase
MPDLLAHQDRLLLIVSSFDGELLRIFQRHNKNVLIALLLSRRDPYWLASLRQIHEIKPDALHLTPDLFTFTMRLLAWCAQMRIALWTINDREQAKIYFNRGVDAIFTDNVPEIVKALRH